MQTMAERVSKVVQSSGMTKTAFAEKINVSQAFVSQMCSGASKPSDRTIADICREFGVSEAWLRDGVEPMYRPKSRNDELTAFMGDILSGDPDFRARFVSVLARLSTDEWALLEKMAQKLVEETKKEETGQ